MHPQLADIAGDFEAALVRARVLAGRLTDDAWRRRPRIDARGRRAAVLAGGWSPAECLAHLNLTSAAYVPIVEAAVEEARRSGVPAPARYRRDPVGWVLWKLTGPQGRFKVKTAPAFVPTADRPPADLMVEFERWQDVLIGLVRAADGLAIDRVRVTSPFDHRLRYSAYSALTILPRHQHRHLRQAERAAGL